MSFDDVEFGASGICRKVQRYPVLDGDLMLVLGTWKGNCLMTLCAANVAHFAFYGTSLPHGISVDLSLTLFFLLLGIASIMHLSAF